MLCTLLHSYKIQCSNEITLTHNFKDIYKFYFCVAAFEKEKPGSNHRVFCGCGKRVHKHGQL